MSEKTVEIAWPKPAASELRRIADQLDTDGFNAAAEAYRDRIDGAKAADREASKATQHLRDIDQAAKDVERNNPDEMHGDIGTSHSSDRGKALASWLVQQGWSPPESMKGLVVRGGSDVG